MDVFTGQRAYLIKVAESENRIADIEERIRETSKRYLATQWVSLVVGGLAGLASLYAVNKYLSENYSSVYDFNTQSALKALVEALLLLFLVFYPVFFSIVYLGYRSSPERRTFSALVTCISTVDKAMGTPYASKERKKLASKVLDCVRTMRSYRPLIPLRMHKRVMSKEAIRASQYLKALVYPAMFGTDRELARLKKDLARAAINVGNTDWTQVGGVKAITVSRRTNASAVTASLIPLLTIVVPLVTALVTAVVAFAPKQSATQSASTPGPSATPSGTAPVPSGIPTGARTPSPQAGSGH